MTEENVVGKVRVAQGDDGDDTGIPRPAASEAGRPKRTWAMDETTYRGGHEGQEVQNYLTEGLRLRVPCVLRGGERHSADSLRQGSGPARVRLKPDPTYESTRGMNT